ncbi:MAG TPA: hypothetical protein VFM80_08675 [Gracilimonas sp.]|uniref:hypothetical protein n=1 Tax=Gracilimonas sp. TaxID=1974203 RepID=UPI002DAD1369|nr:hypothetical protein [Gracilimonas sp.]
MNKTTFPLFFACLCILLQGCQTWYALEYKTESQPIQFGPHIAASKVDTLGLISGYFKQYSEEEVYSESENLSITLGGEDYMEENLSYTVYRALEDNPEHFIADGFIEIKVKQGVTFWGFLRNVIAGAITGEETNGGGYSTETIRYIGVVYNIHEGGSNDEK